MQTPSGVDCAGDDDASVPSAVVGHPIRQRGGRSAVIAGFDRECRGLRDWKFLLGQATVEIAK